MQPSRDGTDHQPVTVTTLMSGAIYGIAQPSISEMIALLVFVNVMIQGKKVGCRRGQAQRSPF